MSASVLSNALPIHPSQAFNKSDPINLIATDRVKCINCGEYIELARLHHHLLIHSKKHKIFGKYSKLSSSEVTAVSTNQPSTLMHINTNYNYIQGIDVQTFNHQQLPLPEQTKRSMSVPRPSENRLTQSKPIQPIQILGLQHPTRYDSIIKNKQVPFQSRKREIERSDYFQEVNLKMRVSRIKVEKRSVSCCKNRVEGLETDYHLDREIANPEATKHHQSPSTYQILNLRDAKQDSVDPETERSELGTHSKTKQGRVSRISVIPHQNNYLSVDNPSRLSSTSKHFTPSSIKQTPNLSFLRSNVSGQEPKCPCCNGFYCSYCKSTIHPQFRRPPASTNSQISPSKFSLTSQTRLH